MAAWAHRNEFLSLFSIFRAGSQVETSSEASPCVEGEKDYLYALIKQIGNLNL